MRRFSETRSSHQPLLHPRQLPRASSQLVSILPPASSPWTNSEPSVKKPRKTTKMMRSSYPRLISIELKMPRQLKPRINFFKKRSWQTSKKLLLLLSLKPRRRRWSRWIRLGRKKCNQQISRSIRCLKMRHYSLRHKRCLIMSLMMSSKWIRWSSTPRLSLSEINNWKRTRDLSPNGLKNRRSLTSWWKLRDSRSFKRRKKEKSERLLLEKLEPRSSLIRSKRELSKEWKNRSSETKKRSSSRPT